MAQQGPPTNLIANPMASGLHQAGSFIITGGMYGSGQERILVHTGGIPSAPPPNSNNQAPQLSPVFILPPPAAPAPTPCHPSEGSDDVGISLPSFGGSFEGCLSNGPEGKGLRTPLLSEGVKLSRTPLPVIGGRCIMDVCLFTHGELMA